MPNIFQIIKYLSLYNSIVCAWACCRGVKLKGITSRGSSHQLALQASKDVAQPKEVTCDKAPLTKHEYVQSLFTAAFSVTDYISEDYNVEDVEFFFFLQEITSRSRTAHRKCMRPPAEET